MLTREGEEERAWAGLNSLRHLLEARRGQSEDELYPTSIWQADVDQYRTYALLATVVARGRDELLEAVGAEGRRDDALRHGVKRDLDELSGRLRGLSSSLDTLAREVDAIQRELWSRSK